MRRAALARLLFRRRRTAPHASLSHGPFDHAFVWFSSEQAFIKQSLVINGAPQLCGINPVSGQHDCLAEMQLSLGVLICINVFVSVLMSYFYPHILRTLFVILRRLRMRGCSCFGMRAPGGTTTAEADAAWRTFYARVALSPLEGRDGWIP